MQTRENLLLLYKPCLVIKFFVMAQQKRAKIEKPAEHCILETGRSSRANCLPFSRTEKSTRVMTASTSNLESYLLIKKEIAFYDRLDLALKVFLFVGVLILLLSIGSLTLALWFVVALSVIKGLSSLAAYLLVLSFKRWFEWKSYSLIDGSTKERVGKYFVSDVRQWTKEIANRLGISSPVALLVYDTKHANAFARKRRIALAYSRQEITLLSNLFHILTEDELKTVIAHELGHLQNWRSISLVSDIVGAFWARRIPYSWCLEYLADYAAGRVAGVVPTVNALIKLHSRNYLIGELWKRLTFVMGDMKLGIRAISELNDLVEEVLPHSIKGLQDVRDYMKQVVDRYFAKRVGDIKGIGEQYARKYKRAKQGHSRVPQKWHAIDWTAFDTRVRDNYLDEIELEKLYQYLKGHGDAQLFFCGKLETIADKRRHSHPPLRDRIIFLMESVQKGSCSFQNDGES